MIIKASDTEFLVIHVAISVFQIVNNIGLEKLWVAFSHGSNFWWIPMHNIRRSIGSVK